MSYELAGAQYRYIGAPPARVVTLAGGVPTDVGEDAVVTFSTFAEVKAFADFFATGSMRCSVNSGSVWLNWGTQVCCDWFSLTKGQAAASSTR